MRVTSSTRSHPNFYPRSPCGERLAIDNAEINKHDNFYPRSPCGERLVHFDNYNLHCVISIHALLAESDFGFTRSNSRSPIFLSTLSLRRATPYRFVHGAGLGHFYPRSPCGERLTAQHQKFVTEGTFLSTLSLRRATGGSHQTERKS